MPTNATPMPRNSARGAPVTGRTGGGRRRGRGGGRGWGGGHGPETQAVSLVAHGSADLAWPWLARQPVRLGIQQGGSPHVAGRYLARASRERDKNGLKKGPLGLPPLESRCRLAKIAACCLARMSPVPTGSTTPARAKSSLARSRCRPDDRSRRRQAGPDVRGGVTPVASRPPPSAGASGPAQVRVSCPGRAAPGARNAAACAARAGVPGPREQE
jgi:hypothetical protein